jgi:hypothetical protein
MLRRKLSRNGENHEGGSGGDDDDDEVPPPPEEFATIDPRALDAASTTSESETSETSDSGDDERGGAPPLSPTTAAAVTAAAASPPAPAAFGIAGSRELPSIELRGAASRNPSPRLSHRPRTPIDMRAISPTKSLLRCFVANCILFFVVLITRYAYSSDVVSATPRSARGNEFEICRADPSVCSLTIVKIDAND